MVLYIVTLLKVTWHWCSDTVVYDLLKVAGYKSVIFCLKLLKMKVKKEIVAKAYLTVSLLNQLCGFISFDLGV